MNTLNPEKYHQLVAAAQTADFSGWDFHWLENRMIQEEPPWNYPDIVKAQFAQVNSLLDLGTGGGELLASLAPLPAETHATETYPPNQVIAQSCLQPLGVKVHAIHEGARLPFNDAHFDLVIARHESFNPDEVFRILKPGGLFITQQVGGLDNLELNQVLQEEPSFPYLGFSLAQVLTDLYKAGFTVERAEKAALSSIFKDIGAVVYYLKAIPWQVEGFSPETHEENLIKLHNIIERQGQFVATSHRFLIIARKEVL